MKFSAFTFIVAALGFPIAALSQTSTLKNESALSADFWRVTASPATTYHFSGSSDHKAVVLLGLEKQYANSTLLGGALFTNSFGQPSVYAYGGKHIANLMAIEPLFLQWTVGMVYGYTGEFKDKVPLNYQGFSPVGVVSLGWKFNRTYSAQLNLLGTSAVMLQLSADLR